jgi:hypothetical protein
MRFLDPTQERRLDKLLSAASECCSRATPVTILDVKVDAKGQRWGRLELHGTNSAHST